MPCPMDPGYPMYETILENVRRASVKAPEIPALPSSVAFHMACSQLMNVGREKTSLKRVHENGSRICK